MRPPNFGRTNGRIVLKIGARIMPAHLRFILIASILLLAAPVAIEDDRPPLTIKLAGFWTEDIPNYEIASKIEQTIVEDLMRDREALNVRSGSDHWSPFDTVTALLDPEPDYDAWGTPPLAYWRTHGAKALVTGKLTREDDGRLKIEARLWDVTAGHYLAGQQYRVEPEHWRQIGHIIADTIYTRLTGRDGRFEADNPE
jgi:hypothetical protein